MDKEDLMVAGPYSIDYAEIVAAFETLRGATVLFRRNSTPLLLPGPEGKAWLKSYMKWSSDRGATDLRSASDPRP